MNLTIENEIVISDSKLGTKEYWDNFYENEKIQFSNNSELIGEVWFGKQIQKKIVLYINDNYKKESKILDVGCGNAAFLLSLAKLDFLNLNGIDYSQNSITLAESVISEKIKKHPKIDNKIKLYAEDINNPLDDDSNFDLIHDKGTMDAFLSNKENKFESYNTFLRKKLATDGVFVITSCNFTKTELEFLFSKTNLTFIKEIAHKQFTFGGNVGQTVTSLIYKNKLSI